MKRFCAKNSQKNSSSCVATLCTIFIAKEVLKDLISASLVFQVKCPGELCGDGVALVVNRTFYGVSNTLKGYNQLGDVDK